MFLVGGDVRETSEEDRALLVFGRGMKLFCRRIVIGWVLEANEGDLGKSIEKLLEMSGN